MTTFWVNKDPFFTLKAQPVLRLHCFLPGRFTNAGALPPRKHLVHMNTHQDECPGPEKKSSTVCKPRVPGPFLSCFDAQEAHLVFITDPLFQVERPSRLPAESTRLRWRPFPSLVPEAWKVRRSSAPRGLCQLSEHIRNRQLRPLRGSKA